MMYVMYVLHVWMECMCNVWMDVYVCGVCM